MEGHGRIRPGADGLWVAYTAVHEGSVDVFVKEVTPGKPGAGRVRKVSSGNGAEPVWSPKGDQIFFRSRDGTKLYAAAFTAEPALSVGEAKLLLDNLSMPQSDLSMQRSYDISHDGTRFLMVFADPEASGGKSIVVVQNWFEELKAKFGAK